MSNIGNYEAKVAAVETIIAEIESGRLPLEEVFSKFAIAVEELQQCETILARGKEQMTLLIESLDTEEEEF